MRSAGFFQWQGKALDKYNSYSIIGIAGGEPHEGFHEKPYALRLMLALALHEGENLSVKTVAAMQGISEKYLEQVIPRWCAGYVKSVRGARGGIT